MSNAGQALGAVVGGVIGFFIGGPQGAVYGFQLGLLAGSALFPTQLPGVQGPRLGDGQQTTSIVGAPIPWVVGGTQRVGGIVIWASPIREVAETQTAGGKGSPEQSQTTYRYFRSFAVLLCEPPDPLAGETIQGVRRIWANGKLILDKTRPPDIDLESIAANTLAQLAGRQAINTNWENRMTFYPGSEDQLPDPVIDSFEGVGNVPGYRGYSYVVFDDVELKPEDGNRIPASWSFEVYTSGSSISIDLSQYANERMYPWLISSVDPRAPGNVHLYGVSGTSGDQTLPTVSAALNALGPDEGFYALESELRGWYTSDNTTDLMPFDELVSSTEQLRLVLWYARWVSPQIRINDAEDLDMCDTWPACEEPRWSHTTGFGSHGTYQVTDNSQCVNAFGMAPGTQFGICAGTVRIWRLSDGPIWVARFPSPPPSACHTLLTDAPGYCVDANGTIIPDTGWVYDDSTTYRALQSYEDDNFNVTRYPLEPIRPLGHSQYNDQAFWESAYHGAVARGDLPSGWTYGVEYPTTQGYGYKIQTDTGIVDTDLVSLAELVRKICERAGNRVDLLYDVTDLEGVFVIGFQVSRPMPARSAIDVLRPVGYFDAVESSIQLRFVARGKAPVMTLTDDELGAHFADAERIPKTVVQKKLEFELPRSVRVHYQNPLRDLEPGEEGSPPREDTDAQSSVDMEIPLAIESDHAARIAEVVSRDLWVSRYTYSTSVDVSKRVLEPTDCILLPVDGRLERARIASVMDTLPNLRALSLVKDDDGTYVSTATGTERFVFPDGIVYYGPVASVLLDLPPLDITEDDRAGFYFAARPLITSGAFRGATLSRSADGTNFTTVAGTSDATPMGTLLYDLPDGTTTGFDWDNEIVVEMQYGALESRDEIDVLGGANAAAVGADGRWEIVQFVEATEIADNIYRLRGLLRGRRGTEWIAQLEQTIAGDQFVMLSLGTIARVPLDPVDVNLALDYRTTATGKPLESATTVSFTGRGAALRPFSPVNVAAVIADSDWTFTWLRRDRLASDIVIPMSEEREDYEVDVMRNGEAIRTISVLEKSATYTSEQQVVDFGSTQSTITIRVYQISAAVGRSYPQEATFVS